MRMIEGNKPKYVYVRPSCTNPSIPRIPLGSDRWPWKRARACRSKKLLWNIDWRSGSGGPQSDQRIQTKGTVVSAIAIKEAQMNRRRPVSRSDLSATSSPMATSAPSISSSRETTRPSPGGAVRRELAGPFPIALECSETVFTRRVGAAAQHHVALTYP